SLCCVGCSAADRTSSRKPSSRANNYGRRASGTKLTRSKSAIERSLSIRVGCLYWAWLLGCDLAPQRLKPAAQAASNGTAEAVPLPKVKLGGIVSAKGKS